ncbi:MAG: hypothetical protein PHD61_05855 [Bacteroidales bacterium]|nr:hypothetical protein [Bacteroidales bacterium]
MYRTGIILFVLLMAMNLASSGQMLVETGQHPVTLQLPAIALLDIEPNTSPVALSLDAPTEAGQSVVAGSSSTNNSCWLNYTSAVAAGGSTRHVTVQITGGAIPGGLSITLQAGAYSGGGAGVLGTPGGALTLSATPQSCINGIKGAYTGNGSNNGHRLTYTLAITDYSQLTGGTPSSLTITYTMVDN